MTNSTSSTLAPPVDSGPGHASRSRQRRGRRFGVFDWMVCIGGIASLITYGSRDFVALIEQLMGLADSLASRVATKLPQPSNSRPMPRGSGPNGRSAICRYGRSARRPRQGLPARSARDNRLDPPDRRTQLRASWRTTRSPAPVFVRDSACACSVGSSRPRPAR